MKLLAPSPSRAWIWLGDLPGDGTLRQRAAIDAAAPTTRRVRAVYATTPGGVAYECVDAIFISQTFYSPSQRYR